MPNKANHRDVFFVAPAAPQKYARVGGVEAVEKLMLRLQRKNYLFLEIRIDCSLASVLLFPRKIPRFRVGVHSGLIF